MSAVHFSYVDVGVAGIVLVSAGYAIWRGFVSETLSIISWAAAAFAALYFGPSIAPHAKSLISPPWLATAASYLVVFVAVLIPLSFVSFRFAENVHNSPVGALDRTLGGIFGVVRGLAVVGLAYIVFSAFVPVPTQPAWIKNASSLPFIQSTAQVILSLVPDQGVKIDGKEITAPAIKPGGTQKKTYSAGERQELDKLIEDTGSGDK
ncbi:MAG TPA: CvpA family protein [Rhizomicrobium sp.]|nr:CvpA family protein [Rhizomicrobium sp.]